MEEEKEKEEFEEKSCSPEEFKKWVCEQEEALVLFLPDESDASVEFAAKLSQTEYGDKLSVVVAEGECEELAKKEGLEKVPAIVKYKGCEKIETIYFSGNFEEDMKKLKKLTSS